MPRRNSRDLDGILVHRYDLRSRENRWTAEYLLHHLNARALRQVGPANREPQMEGGHWLQGEICSGSVPRLKCNHAGAGGIGLVRVVRNRVHDIEVRFLFRDGLQSTRATNPRVAEVESVLRVPGLGMHRQVISAG